ncbi:hypothetical protein Halxa_2864 [Halopiger xanaduensis SH-6]|uniref:Uncharacterized protein n=1 Tax=Halopiger xanaduensis (strain DSM 18323 / JCM 14033 / SH-6) TaxID=797210 RepID=F8D480_HALXS|nr:hypothetical protein Halxa_2864 [Halopiger xanaduensis SH-6]
MVRLEGCGRGTPESKRWRDGLEPNGYRTVAFESGKPARSVDGEPRSLEAVRDTVFGHSVTTIVPTIPALMWGSQK